MCLKTFRFRPTVDQIKIHEVTGAFEDLRDAQQTLVGRLGEGDLVLDHRFLLHGSFT